MLYRELGALMRSGLALAPALDVLIAAPEMGEQRARIAAARDRLREGSSLASALHAMSPAVSAYEVAVIGRREKRSTRFSSGSRRFSRTGPPARQDQSALIYPAIVFILSIVIGLFMMGLMIPRISRLLAESSIPLPPVTRFVMAMGRGLLPATIVVLVLGAAATVVFRQRARAGAAPLADAWFFRLPLWSRPYTALVSLRFSRTLALLMSGGVPIVDGLSLAARATGNAWIAELGARAAEMIRQGRSVADAIRTSPPLSASPPLWFQAGEASGKLESLLTHAGDRFQQQWERLVSRAVAVSSRCSFWRWELRPAGRASVLLPILSLNQMIHDGGQVFSDLSLTLKSDRAARSCPRSCTARLPRCWSHGPQSSPGSGRWKEER